MPKSKYPSKLDSSIEIPAVRDNITEIGSDVINSLRSAIFAIEQTLGIDPHGNSGNTVANRLSQALDDNGNILPSALSMANVLSGPILDNDVSDVAAVKESKLKLDFPTKVLQSEISSLQSELDEIISGLEALNASLSTHISPLALNRHRATAISVDNAIQESSSEATRTVPPGNLQEALSEIYSGHINLSTTSISSINRSHSADQIYFDSSDISGITLSGDVQSAIVDVANMELNSLKNVVLNNHSNGRVRTGSIVDGYEGDSQPSLIIGGEAVTYLFSNGSSKTTFTFTDTPAFSSTISKNDLLILSGSENEEDNRAYQIESYTTSLGNLITVTVFGGPHLSSLAGLTASIYKNNYSSYNMNGLNSAVRPRPNRTNTPDIVVCNPDSATIITSGFQPSRITSSENTFAISIDGNSSVDISLYDLNVSLQTIDSCVNKINEQCVDSRLNLYAFKIKVGDSYEIALSHSVPNFSGDLVNRTLEVSVGSSNDAFSIIGLSDYEDVEVEGSTGNAFVVNGVVYKNIIDLEYFSGTKVQISTSDNKITIFDNTFHDYSIGIGDTVTIYGSSEEEDDGTYRVSSVLDSVIILDGSYYFQGLLDENSIVIIQKNSARIEELNFTEISGADGSILFDVFLTEDKRIHYSKRFEAEGSLQSGGFYAAVVDVSRDFISNGQTATVTVDTIGFVTLTGPDLVAGNSVFISSPGFYKIFSASGLSWVTLQVKTSGLPVSDKTITIYGFDELSRNNYRLCRGLFSTALGRVFGEYLEAGVPTLIDKRRSGTVDDTIISESVIERYIEGPRNELRASGIISGCEVSNVQFFTTYYTLDISPGVFVSNGIRYEFGGEAGYRVNLSSDFYIAFDQYGYIRAEAEISYSENGPPVPATLVSPFYMRTAALLAKVFTSEDFYDLRLFVDRVDYKLLNKIIVANREGFGHFDNVPAAVKYARNFSKMYPKMGIPEVFISAGEYSISETIYIDADMEICGAGPNTIIKKTGALATGVTPRIVSTKIVPDIRSSLFYVGTVGENISPFRHGVSFRNFSYVTSDQLQAVSVAITVSSSLYGLDDSVTLPSDYNPTFRIKDVNFIGTSSMEYSATVEDAVGEFAVAIAVQDDTVTFDELSVAVGNVIVSGCYFYKMGVEKGPIYLSIDDTVNIEHKNILATTNITNSLSPIVLDPDCSIFQNIITLVSIINTNVLEPGNAINLS